MAHNLRTRAAAVMALLLGASSFAWAQSPASVRADSVNADTTRCVGCLAAPQPGRAVLASSLGLIAPWAVNKWVRQNGISNTYPRTWWSNISGRWEWDGNSFGINQFGHPLQGSMYYSGFRANGYGFGTSAAAATVGSFLWECCFETNKASINDIVTTAIGGMSVGEYAWRLSDLVLDNRSSGIGRVVRETAAGVINPVRFAHRIARGEAWRRGSNPPRPETLASRISVGALGVAPTVSGDRRTLTGAAVSGVIIYGDPIENLAGKPFSYFDMQGVLTSIPQATFYEVRAQASLAGRVLTRRGAKDQRAIGALLQYEYDDNRAFEYGAQKVALAYLGRWRLGARTTLLADATARGIVLGAIGVESAVVSEEGRDYDFGSGGGGSLDATLSVRDVGELRLSGATIGLVTADGVADSHLLRRGTASATLHVTKQLGVSAAFRNNWRRSFYGEGRSTIADAPEWRLFVTRLTHRGGGTR